MSSAWEVGEHTPIPEEIEQAWQIMASTAHVLDPPYHATMTDLFGMIVISEAMDRLVKVSPPYPEIKQADHAAHTPRQAAACALGHLSAYTPVTAEETARIDRVKELLRSILRHHRGTTATTSKHRLPPS